MDSFEKFMPDVYEFYNLGIGEPYPVSASSMLGLGDMLDAVIAHFPEHFCRGRGGRASESSHCREAQCREILDHQPPAGRAESDRVGYSGNYQGCH